MQVRSSTPFIFLAATVLIINSSSSTDHAQISETELQAVSINECEEPKHVPEAENINVVNERVYYSPELRRAGIEGSVVLTVLVDKDGSIVQKSIKSAPHKKLGREVMKASEHLEFKPGICAGEPAVMYVDLPAVHFRIAR